MQTSESSFQPINSTKKSHQFKALFFKSAALQSKQIGTNLCQILTPIICLLFTYIIKKIVGNNLTNISQDDYIYPLPFNTFVATPLQSLINYTQPQWYLYSTTPSVDQTILGVNDGTTLSSGGVLAYALGNRTANVNFAYGNFSKNVTAPFFLPNNLIDVNLDLAAALEYLNSVPLDKDLDILPDGAISFKILNSTYLEANLFINDCRNYQYHRDSGITIIDLRNSNTTQFNSYVTVAEGQLQLLDMLNQAYVKYSNGGQKGFSSGIIYMPNASGSNSLVNSLINIVSATIFPLALSLLFPVFLYAIVLEKQEKLIQMMKMNGMSMRYYWLVTFVFNLFLSFLTNMIFYLFGYFIVKTNFFTQTAFSILFTVLFGWMLAQIGMATLFQTIISNSRSANIIGYLFSIWTSLIGASLSLGVYAYPGTTFPLGLQILSFFGFPRIFYILLSQCSLNNCVKSLHGLPQELRRCIIFLYINFFVFFLLGIYLHQIIPQQFGIARSPFFPFTYLKNLFNKKSSNNQIQEDPQYSKYISDDFQEDQDSKNERIQVSRLTQFRNYPLVCNNLRKIYIKQKQNRKQQYAAVKSFNLIIQPNQIFGLLGPNGAGKTTLISLITGMYEPNNGNAWVGGYNIRQQIQKVHLEMGVCPQFDLLWPELTIEQHLYFYARLKGIDRADERIAVEQSMVQVNLEKFRNFKARQLSGGMKRRLSVAISLVGNPQIIFLDQPTTGLDPDNRRSLWTVLSKCRQKRAMFLTTHMMDQADALCNRIGIITNGVLRTVANQLKLRKNYGDGYRLDLYLQRQQQKLHQSQFNKNQNNEQNQIIKLQQQQQVKELEKQKKMRLKNQKLIGFIKKRFPLSRLLKVFNGNFKFKLGPGLIVSEVFEIIEKRKKQLNISYWGITNSSLEDVFLTVVQKFDKQQVLQQDIRRSLRKSQLLKLIKQQEKQFQKISQSGKQN